MKIAILSANLGGFDPDIEHVGQELPQDTELIFHSFNDENFKPVLQKINFY